ncbi:MAG: hypothetical protein L0226_15505 [Acidobacteria bacterium]|nr:hypothetical protein [Acidobacteriota bacterium]
MNQVSRIKRIKIILLFCLVFTLVVSVISANRKTEAISSKTSVAAGHKIDQAQQQPQQEPKQVLGQKRGRVNPRSAGCVVCHTGTESMHFDGDDDLDIGCTDCHGGNPVETVDKFKAHVLPRNKELFTADKTANLERLNALWLKESEEYIRFINPGDFRAADLACGKCHANEVMWMKKSMMTHGGMLWGAALYNNGAYPLKDAHFGESYGIDGSIQGIYTNPAPSPQETLLKGVLPYLEPLPRWEVMQPGNVLRVFERGGEIKGLPSDIGSPNSLDLAGKPEVKLSDRGFGTRLRTDPVFLGLQKTRLLDPLLSFPGTNDHPGDYRGSGCTACHVVYANDRDPKHSGPFAKYGNLGLSLTADPTIPKGEKGHPVKHQMTNGVPSSQCMTCHIHPGGNMLLSYYGMIWWDNETDGHLMYPEKQPDLSDEQKDVIQFRNPEGAAMRGKWGQDWNFLVNIWNDINPKASRVQFGDLHGHGWVFRNVYKSDRKGNMLTSRGAKIKPDDPEKFKKAVHLEDIHQKNGMHCADCHVGTDVHGNGNLYNEPRAAVQIDCIDCHGTIDRPATLTASGPAAGTARVKGKVVSITKDLTKVRVRDERDRLIPMFQRASADRPIKKKAPDGKEVEFKNGEIIQNSMVEPGKWWRVVQTVDTVTQGKRDYNDASAYAKTIQRDGKMWGDNSASESALAHANSKMTCYSCHTSWTTSCFGCHLPMVANKQKPMLHNEGSDELRNYTQYNFQTLRDDIFMLGKDGTVTGRRIAPARSTCAVLVGSQNQNREWLYSQQQTISSEGYSGHAFSTFVPHTVSTSDTKVCTDCHISKSNDNNAIMAQLLMQGTNFVNFIGRFAWVAAGKHGIHAVVVTERTEPQAVIGSSLHKLAYPEEFNKHAQRGDNLKEAFEHSANGEALAIQVRGEYAYVANGPGGLRVYDIANIDNKGFSERITTAPVSPFGQRFYVKTKFATGVASPSTLAIDPLRKKRPENQEAEYRDDKQPIHPIYAFLYVSDKIEGLVVVGDRKKGVVTLLDGDPANNFLKRALAFNPDGALNGASNITIAGIYAYITCERGLAIVNLNNPLDPKLVTILSGFKKPHAVAIQFRYAFVVDEEGLKVVDVTLPEKARLVDGALVPFADAHNLYLARTYAYVAAGKDGLVIVDIERPEKPKIDQTINAEGKINDAHDVKVGMTNNSLFAYVADGKNGLRVVQLMSPEENPNIFGFSPRAMAPKLIATFHLEGEALAISKGIDRDRAVDESGNQIAVFSRRGSRPFNLQEMQRLYLRDGQLYTVTDEPPPRPRKPAATAEISSVRSIIGLMSKVWMHLLLGMIGLVGLFGLKRLKG